jgi:hypothetical protein
MISLQKGLAVQLRQQLAGDKGSQPSGDDIHLVALG